MTQPEEKWPQRHGLLYLRSMVTLNQVVVLVVAFGCLGCASSPEPSTPPAPTETTGGEANDVSTNADAELVTLEAAAAPVPEPAAPRQGDVIDAGTIARARLQAVVAGGIPRFLQSVRTEPHKEGARFVGWRLISIFDDPSFALGPLRIGDTVLGVNGRTIERPEQFFSVWETLSNIPQLTFQVLRDGQAYEVRYAIQD